MTEPSGSRAPVLLVAVAVVCLALGTAVGLLVAGSLLTPAGPAYPADASVDAGFARDMQEHHTQAVDMALAVRETSQDEDVRRLAQDILTTQQQQAGQMYGWLETWGLPQARPGEPMAWMGHGEGAAGGHGHDAGHDTPAAGHIGMPGMATPEQLERLRAAEGPEADRIFLALMIPHHQGGVEMARAAVEGAEQPQVVRLAQAVVSSQRAEITVLEQMLAERGGPPAGL